MFFVQIIFVFFVYHLTADHAFKTRKNSNGHLHANCPAYPPDIHRPADAQRK